MYIPRGPRGGFLHPAIPPKKSSHPAIPPQKGPHPAIPPKNVSNPAIEKPKAIFQSAEDVTCTRNFFLENVSSPEKFYPAPQFQQKICFIIEYAPQYF